MLSQLILKSCNIFLILLLKKPALPMCYISKSFLILFIIIILLTLYLYIYSIHLYSIILFYWACPTLYVMLYYLYKYKLLNISNSPEKFIFVVSSQSGFKPSSVVMLYDTSTEEEVNINRSCLYQMQIDTLAPSIKEVGFLYFSMKHM